MIWYFIISLYITFALFAGYVYFEKTKTEPCKYHDGLEQTFAMIFWPIYLTRIGITIVYLWIYKQRTGRKR